MGERLLATETCGVFAPQYPVYLREERDAIALVTSYAERARAAGTIGVAALALDDDGRLLAVAENRVVRDGSLADPTAHAEMGLLRHLERERGFLVITSLEPCLMCGGALRERGIGTRFVAEDAPAALRRGDFRVTDALPELRARAALAFGDSLATCREHCVAGATPDGGLLDPAMSLSNGHPLRRALDALGARWGGAEESAIDEVGRDDAAAIIDPFGNWLCCVDDRSSEPPLIRAIREYSAVRHAHRRDAEWNYLAHLRHCSLLTRRGPGVSPRGELLLGAYGAALDGKRPVGQDTAWRYRRGRVSEHELGQWLAALPPLYRETLRMQVCPAH